MACLLSPAPPPLAHVIAQPSNSTLRQGWWDESSKVRGDGTGQIKKSPWQNGSDWAHSIAYHNFKFLRFLPDDKDKPNMFLKLLQCYWYQPGISTADYGHCCWYIWLGWATIPFMILACLESISLNQRVRLNLRSYTNHRLITKLRQAERFVCPFDLCRPTEKETQEGSKVTRKCKGISNNQSFSIAIIYMPSHK